MKTPAQIRAMILEINDARFKGQTEKNVTRKQLKSWENRASYLTRCLNVLTELPEPESNLKKQQLKLKKIYESAKKTYRETSEDMKEYWDEEAAHVVRPFLVLGKFHKASGMARTYQQLRTIKFLLSDK